MGDFPYWRVYCGKGWEQIAIRDMTPEDTAVIACGSDRCIVRVGKPKSTAYVNTYPNETPKGDFVALTHLGNIAGKLEGNRTPHTYDPKKCGALQLWEHTHRDQKPPRLLPYINAMLTWDWSLKDSRNAYEVLQSKAPNFAWYRKVNAYSDERFQRWLSKGKILANANRRLCIEIASKVWERTVFQNALLYKVHVVVSSVLIDGVAEYDLNRGAHQACAVVCPIGGRGAASWRVFVRASPTGTFRADLLAKRYDGDGKWMAASFAYTGNISDLFTEQDVITGGKVYAEDRTKYNERREIANPIGHPMTAYELDANHHGAHPLEEVD